MNILHACLPEAYSIIERHCVGGLVGAPLLFTRLPYRGHDSAIRAETTQQYGPYVLIF